MEYIRQRKPAKDPLRQIDDGGLKVVLEEEKTTAEKLNGFSAPVLTSGKLKELPHRSLSSQGKMEALSLTEVAVKEALKQINTQNSYESIGPGRMYLKEIKHAAISCGR